MEPLDDKMFEFTLQYYRGKKCGKRLRVIGWDKMGPIIQELTGEEVDALFKKSICGLR